jgi:REP element-mobilizing transposase RayT
MLCLLSLVKKEEYEMIELFGDAHMRYYGKYADGCPVWQSRFHEHIIRNKPELNKIREYIINNPLNWETDENYKN